MGEGFVPGSSEPGGADQRNVFAERSQSARTLLSRFWKPAAGMGAGAGVGGLVWLLSRRRKKRRVESSVKKPLMALSGAVLLLRRRLRAAKRKIR